MRWTLVAAGLLLAASLGALALRSPRGAPRPPIEAPPHVRTEREIDDDNAACAEAQHRTSMADELRRWTPPGALDCGQAGAGESPAALLRCASDAAARKQPFSASIVELFVDVSYEYGFVGRVDAGTFHTYVFEFGSEACSAPAVIHQCRSFSDAPPSGTDVQFCMHRYDDCFRCDILTTWLWAHPPPSP